MTNALNAGAATRFYVSPAGNDGWSGTRMAAGWFGRGPFRTLERARDEIRARRQAGRLRGPAEVLLAGGTYVLERGLALGKEDSGTPEAPVIIQALPGAEARLLGGRPVAGFKPVDDPAILARLTPEARGHVLQADLKAQGLSDFGLQQSRGFSRPSVPAALELFFAGQPMTVARWPNEGFATIAGLPASMEADGHGGQLGTLEGGFLYEGDRPRQWRNTQDVWVHGYWAWDWANSYEKVATLDPDRRLIKTAAPYGLYGFRKGQRIYFLNILEELDRPGEWYLERQSGILYFWPPAPIASGEALVSVVEDPLIALRGASHVILRDLTLEAGRGCGIRMEGGASNLVDRCVLRNLGSYGIQVYGGNGHGVLHCEILNTGDGGIQLVGGDRKTLTPCGHCACGNHIHHVARWSKCYVPAVLAEGVGMHVAGNLIHDHPHCAILFSGNEIVVELNEIHHVCMETGDVGAIYTGRDWTFRGNVIRHNYIHHTGGVGMGSMGVYMDDCVSGTRIEGNVFYKVQRAVMLGGGRDFRVENNVFVDCTPAIWLDGRGLDKAPVWHDMVYKTMRQRLEDMRWRQTPYSVRYPELAALEPYYARDDGVPPENNLAARNLCTGGTWFEATWHDVGHYMQFTNNLVNTDPRFVNAAQGDFRLQPDSPAFSLGFEPIPLDRIGRWE